MRKDLESKLIKRFPKWFDAEGDVRRTFMPFVFQCGDGWCEILWRLCVDLEPLVVELERETGDRFEIVQVNEKVGTLCFHVTYHTDAIDMRIEAAEKEASGTCEICGQPGKLRETGGWARVRCGPHLNQRDEQ